jgi:hypothetical protein
MYIALITSVWLNRYTIMMQGCHWPVMNKMDPVKTRTVTDSYS